MVITRAQSTTNVQNRNSNRNDFSYNESDISLPELNSHDPIAENSVNSNEQERDHERIRIERRFNEMNNLSDELTSLVGTLTEMVASSNKEGNDSNTRNTRSTSHSDMATGVSRLLHSNSTTKPAKTIPNDSPTTADTRRHFRKQYTEKYDDRRNLSAEIISTASATLQRKPQKVQ